MLFGRKEENMNLLKLNIQLFADGKVVIDTDLNTSGFENGLNKMQSIAKTGFKSIATSIGVVTTALAGIVTAGVKSFAELEQNIGGIETLFKNSSERVIENAKQAYETAGLSANQYMETVTSFSARLLQGLGGDTEEAARIADIAIRDMSDNANKMGISMEMIQNAYQGFAKQNYTMLDNLKLGYGGTASEMARLINDSGVLGEGIKVTAETVNEVSFDKMIEAIHKVQENLEITGTTTEEASTTIIGSLKSAGAAWDNFINGSGDIEKFIKTALTAVKNISKALIKLSPNIIDGLIDLANAVIPEIPAIIETIFPTLLDGAINLINGLITVFPMLFTMIEENIPTIIEGGMLIITTLINTLINSLPQILDTGIKLLLELIKGIVNTLPELIPVIIKVVMDIVNILLDNIDLIIEAGIQILVALIRGIMDSLPELIARLPEIIIKIVSTLINLAPQLLSAAIRIMAELGLGLIKSIPDLIAKIPQIITSMVQALGEGVAEFFNIGKNLMLGLWDGIKNTWEGLKSGVKNLGKGIVDGFKNVFGIHSPSRVFADEIGSQLSAGLGVGFEEELDNVYRDMQHAIDLETEKMSANVQSNGTYQMAMTGLPTFNLLDNTEHTTQLVVNGKVLAEVVNTENKNREVATA